MSNATVSFGHANAMTKLTPLQVRPVFEIRILQPPIRHSFFIGELWQFFTRTLSVPAPQRRGVRLLHDFRRASKTSEGQGTFEYD